MLPVYMLLTVRSYILKNLLRYFMTSILLTRDLAQLTGWSTWLRVSQIVLLFSDACSEISGFREIQLQLQEIYGGVITYYGLQLTHR
jgi:hypothetical protein